MYKIVLAVIIVMSFGIFACDDPPTEPAPFQQRDSMYEEFILGRWTGEISWGDNDSVDMFGVEFKVEVDTIFKEITDTIIDKITNDTIIEVVSRDTTLQLIGRVNSEYLNLETGLWENSNGLWAIDHPINRLLWTPKQSGDIVGVNERQMLFTGFRAGDNLYGYVTTAGYEGTWSLRKNNIIE